MQNGFEKTHSLLLSMEVGADMIYGLGLTDSGMTFDIGQYVADHEMIRMLKPITQKIDVSEETLCTGLIEEVGIGGEFITAKHTRKNMRSFALPKLQIREPREKWMKKGQISMKDNANEFAKEILSKHVPTPLPEDQAKAIRKIVQDFDDSKK